MSPGSAERDASNSNLTSEKPDVFSACEPSESDNNGFGPLVYSVRPIDWAATDVPGSPRMFRLFEALETETSLPIPPLSLDLENPEELEYISGEEILDLFNGGNRPSIYEIDMEDPGHHYLSHSLRKGARQFPNEYMRSRFYRWTVSLKTELYYFPPCPDVHSRGF